MDVPARVMGVRALGAVTNSRHRTTSAYWRTEGRKGHESRYFANFLREPGCSTYTLSHIARESREGLHLSRTVHSSELSSRQSTSCRHSSKERNMVNNNRDGKIDKDEVGTNDRTSSPVGAAAAIRQPDLINSQEKGVADSSNFLTPSMT